jgi:hypothetical protein
MQQGGDILEAGDSGAAKEEWDCATHKAQGGSLLLCWWYEV